MTNITFTKRDDDWYDATVTGFSGVLQVDRYSPSLLRVYAKTAGCKEVLLFEEYSETTLINVNLAECVTVRIECGKSVIKAQYEEA